MTWFVQRTFHNYVISVKLLEHPPTHCQEVLKKSISNTVRRCLNDTKEVEKLPLPSDCPLTYFCLSNWETFPLKFGRRCTIFPSEGDLKMKKQSNYFFLLNQSFQIPEKKNLKEFWKNTTKLPIFSSLTSIWNAKQQKDEQVHSGRKQECTKNLKQCETPFLFFFERKNARVTRPGGWS